MATVNVTLPQGGTVSEWALMPATALTTTGSTSDFGVDGFSSGEVQVSMSALTGTSAALTFDVYIQRRNPDGTTYDDLAHFAQITTSTSSQVVDFVSGGNYVHTTTTGSLAASTVLPLNMGGFWRIYWVAGTNATATLALWVSFA